MFGFLPDFITREAPEFPDTVTLKHSKRARRVALRLNIKTGTFDLTVPHWMSLHQAHAFVRDNESWMQEKLANLPNGTPFRHGQTIPVLGQPRTLSIKPNPTSARTKITLTDTTIEMLTHLDDPAPRIEKFLKKLAKDTMEPIARTKAAQIGKTVDSFVLRDPKSRWGSCSDDGRVMLSWRLILAPPIAMDYVIAHEVAHLQHMDHSKAFWRLCKDLSEDFKTGHSWMRTHGNSLMRYG